jgi:hypothetical protein
VTALSGGCQCGAVRYELRTPRPAAYTCHCRECQKQSASAFAISVPVRVQDLDVSGPLQAYDRATDSGSRSTCWFCATCGTRIYHQSARSPDLATLKGGTLDDPDVLQPVAHLWVSRRQQWVELPEGAETFDTQPADFKAWRDALVAGD